MWIVLLKRWVTSTTKESQWRQIRRVSKQAWKRVIKPIELEGNRFNKKTGVVKAWYQNSMGTEAWNKSERAVSTVYAQQHHSIQEYKDKIADENTFCWKVIMRNILANSPPPFERNTFSWRDNKFSTKGTKCLTTEHIHQMKLHLYIGRLLLEL